MQSSATSTERAWHPARHRAKLPLPNSPWQGRTDAGIAMHHPPGWPHLSAALCRRAAAPATRGQAMEVPSMGPYLRGGRQAVHSAQLLLSRCRLHRRQLRQGRQAGARRHHPDGWSLRPCRGPGLTSCCTSCSGSARRAPAGAQCRARCWRTWRPGRRCPRSPQPRCWASCGAAEAGGWVGAFGRAPRHWFKRKFTVNQGRRHGHSWGAGSAMGFPRVCSP